MSRHGRTSGVPEPWWLSRFVWLCTLIIRLHLTVKQQHISAGLTNQAMFSIAKEAAHLKNLRLGLFCRVYALGTLKISWLLKFLWQGGIPSITSNALLQLAKGCQFLEELFLEDCVGIQKVRHEGRMFAQQSFRSHHFCIWLCWF